MFVFAAVAYLIASPSVQTAKESSDRDEVFAWFDRLGYSSVLRGPLVRVDQWKWADGNRKIGLVQAYGFALEKKPGRLSFLSLGLSRNSYPSPENYGYSGWSETKVDLDSIANQVLNGSNSGSQTRSRFGEDPDGLIQALVLARACDLAGQKKLSQRLYARSRTWRQGESLKENMAHVLMYSAIEDLSDPTVSWSNLRDRVAIVADHFPRSEITDLAAEYRPILDEMAKEDRLRKPVPTDIESLPVQQQVDIWVYELRNQRGTQGTHTGFCDIFSDPRRGQSPADKLVELGIPAVPRLIQALDDRSLTRCSAWDMHHGLPDVTLRVRDVALQVLSSISFLRIAGREQEGLLTDKTATETKQIAEAWLNKVQTKGLFRVMCEDVKKGDLLYSYVPGRSPTTDEVDLLVKLFPTSSFDPVTYAFQQLPEGSYRRPSLVLKLSGVEDSRVPGFVRHLLESERDSNVRTNAAMVLGESDGDAATRILADIWRDRPRVPPKYFEERQAQFSVVGFLIASKRPEGIKALSSDLLSHDLEVIATILETFVGPQFDFTPEVKRKIEPPTSKEAEQYLTLAQDAIAARLMDARLLGEQVFIKGKYFDGLRVGDLAAAALAANWPNRYRFDPAKPASEREGQRIVCFNTWRITKGLPAFIMPIHHAIAVVNPLNSGPLVDEVLVTNNAKNIEPWVRKAQNFKGKLLKAHAMMSFIEDLIHDFPSSCKSCKIRAERQPHGRGITLKFVFTPSTKIGDYWSIQASFMADGESLGSGTYNYGEGSHDDVLGYIGLNLDKVFAQAPTASLSVSIDIAHVVYGHR